MTTLLLALALVACNTPDAQDTGAYEGPFRAEVSLDAVLPSVVHVRWQPPAEGDSWVEYGLDGPDRSTPVVHLDTQEHQLQLLGLKPSRPYELEAFTRSSDGSLWRSGPGSVTVPPPPAEIPEVRGTWADPDAPSGGLIVSSQMRGGATWVVVLDREGDYVWYLEGVKDTTIPLVQVGLGGHSLVYSQHDQKQLRDLAEVIEVPIDGLAPPTTTRTFNGHHAFAQLPDGSLGRLSLEYLELDLGEESPTPVAVDRVIEVEAGNSDWEAYDVVFSFLGGYQETLTLEDLGGIDVGGAADWIHANSMAYLPQEDAYYVGSLNLSTLVKIQRETGELVWRLGGAHSDFTLTQGSLWVQAHFSHLWEGGVVLMDSSRMVSRAVEYAWDEEARTVQEVWSYAQPEGLRVTFLGDVQKLDSGNYLITWSSEGILEEVTSEGEQVWRLELEPGSYFGRARWIPDLYEPLGG